MKSKKEKSHLDDLKNFFSTKSHHNKNPGYESFRTSKSNTYDASFLLFSTVINLLFCVHGVIIQDLTISIAFSVFILISALLFRWRLNIVRRLEYVIFFYMSTWYTLGLLLVIPSLLNYDRESLFFAGCGFGFLQHFISSHLLKSTYKWLFVVYAILIKSSVFLYFDFRGLIIASFVVQALIDLMNLYLDIKSDLRQRQSFLDILNSKYGSNKFELFLTQNLPDNMLIVSQQGLNKLFANQAHLRGTESLSDSVENHQEYLDSIIIDSEGCQTEELSGVISIIFKSSRFVSLRQFLNKYVELKLFERMITIQGTLRGRAKRKQVLEVKIIPLRWEEVDAISILMSDLTYQEKKLSIINANNQKDRLLSSISHEFKTPLNGIIGTLRLIRQEILDEGVHEMLEICKNNAYLLLHIVNSIIDLHLIRNKKLHINPEEFAVRGMLEDVRLLFEFQCRKKNVDLHVHIADDIPKFIYTDRERLTEIIVNIVSNAVKFTSKGSITISVHSSSRSEEVISFCVQDTGIGIKDPKKINSFSSSGMNDPDPANIRTEGIGLGLAVSDNLCKMLNPWQKGVKVESEYMKGSRFLLEIAKDWNIIAKNAALNTSSVSELKSTHEIITIDEKVTAYSGLVRSIHSKPVIPSLTGILSPASLSSFSKGSLPDTAKFKPIKPSQKDLSMSKVVESNSPDSSMRSERDLIPRRSSISGESELSEMYGGDFSSFHPSDDELDNRTERRRHRARTSVFKRDARSKLLPSVLVVDDNPFNIMVAQKLIEGYGLDVKTAFSGREAIEKVEDSKISILGFSLILMDLQMPVMDGLEATRILVDMMKRGVVREIPIVALTANDSEEDKQMCLESGMKGHIAKPLKPGSLEEIFQLFGIPIKKDKHF